MPHPNLIGVMLHAFKPITDYRLPAGRQDYRSLLLYALLFAPISKLQKQGFFVQSEKRNSSWQNPDTVGEESDPVGDFYSIGIP